MTFLNPLVLFGLAAAAIPIVLHLLNIRKLRIIEFSTLRFLKELQKNRMRKIKLRQWLLLLLRTLLIVLVVLSFSRPALRGSLAGLASHAKTTVVILLDNTASMAASNDRGNYLLQAKEAALSICGLLSEGDDAFLLRLSDVPLSSSPTPTHDVSALREAIIQTEIAPIHRTIDDGLRAAAQVLAQSKNLNQEIHVLTDNRQTAYASTASGQVLPPRAKLFLLPLADKSMENVGIASITIPPSIQQKGKQFLVRAVAHNYGTRHVESLLVSLFFDGARVAQKNLSLESGENAVVEFTILPQRTGLCSGSIQIDDDDLESDNSASFSVAIPDVVQTLLIGPDQESLRYLRLALSAPLSDSTSARIVIREITPAQITSQFLSRSEVIILCNIPSLTETQTELLSSAVLNDGKGLILFPGLRCDGRTWNNTLLPRLGLPAAVWNDTALQRSGAFLTFGTIDREHPIFQSMFDRPAKSSGTVIESPRVTGRMYLATERGIRPIITLSDKKSFLWEKAAGSGLILGFAVPPEPTWSDFPLKGIFLPLMHQTIFYAAQGSGNNGSPGDILAGGRFDLPLSRLHRQTTSRQLTVVSPDTTEELVTPYNVNRGSSITPLISLEHLRIPGLYVIRQGRETVALLSVQADPLESDGTLAESSALTASAVRMGIPPAAVTTIRNKEQITSAVLQTRYGIELWMHFLLAALVVAIIEMIVARESQHD
ncbi:MAG: BatA domain-containing protein [Ignavibacteriales bacterium]|nr:BatA domain-containing protein [Ignavibacteriales bacterium]